MKTIYEEVYGHQNPNGRDAMLKVSQRAQEQLDNLEKTSPGTKKMYNDIWKICGGELGDKFIMVKAMIEDQEWFKTYAKYIDQDFFKDENADVLADIVTYMKDCLARGKDISMMTIKQYVHNLRPSHFPVPLYVDEYKRTVIRAFNCLEDLPEERLEDAKATILSISIQRNTLRRTLSDPDVYIANGFDVRSKIELDRLMNDGKSMLKILNNFKEERELVSDVKVFLMTKAKEVKFDFNAKDFE